MKKMNKITIVDSIFQQMGVEILKIEEVFEFGDKTYFEITEYNPIGENQKFKIYLKDREIFNENEENIFEIYLDLL